MQKQYVNEVCFLSSFLDFLVHFNELFPGKINYLLQNLLFIDYFFLIVWPVLCYDLLAPLRQQIGVEKELDHS